MAEAKKKIESNVKSDWKFDAAKWDTVEGLEHGGSSDVLLMAPGDIVGPLVFIGGQNVETDLGEAMSYTAKTPTGETVRLPIGATFVKAVEQAGLAPGDTFAVKRHPDAIKKRGKGKGNEVAIYGLKVIERADRE